MNQEERLYLESLESFGKQVEQSYQQTSKIKLPKSYQQIDKIVTCGMGGSQLGVEMVRYLFSKEIKIPIIQVRDYNLPKFIDRKTLVFLISYSGSTEEVIKIADQVKKRTDKVFVITMGEKLSSLAKRNHFPFYKFVPIYNPCQQPRTGAGYMVGSFLAILKKLSKIQMTSREINKFASDYEKVFKKYVNGSQIKTLAKEMANKILVFMTAEHLQGNAHILANQTQESAKQMALYFPLPELNHHLLEGLTYPQSNKKNLQFLFFNSDKYHQKNQKRFKITQDVFKKQGLNSKTINLKGSRTEQSITMLVMGSLLAYELSKRNKVNPNAIPWVDLFKAKMSK
jgi:glucose/mannose-6-phosphate isomerase